MANNKSKKTGLVIGIAVAVLAIALVVVKVIVPSANYSAAEKMLAAEDYDGAIAAFTALGNYKDAAARAEDAAARQLEGKYARETIAAGWNHTVALRADGTVAAAGENGDGQCDVSDWTDIVAVSCGTGYTVGLKADGTVVAAGKLDYEQGDCTNWSGIVAVSCRKHHTLGLKADGTLIALGRNKEGQCDVSDWTDIQLPIR